MIEFFSLLSEASEPITKLLGKFFVVEIFRRISWFRIKSGSVSLSRFDLWLVVVDPSERRTAPGAICTPDRPPRMFGSLASEVGQAVLSRTKWWEMSSRSRLGVEDCRCSNNKSLLVFRYPSGNQQEPLLKRVVLPNLPNPNTKKAPRQRPTAREARRREERWLRL